MTNNQLNKYLQEVRNALGNHPEGEEIVQELRAHIWDYANNLSKNSGCSIDDAFSMAINSMENPESMAKSFSTEYSASASSWAEPRSSLPEKKLSDRDFLFIGIIGFFAATIILSLISLIGDITGSDVSAFSFAFTLIQFSILIGLILAIFYYRNEQEFKSQLQKLHEKFAKRDEDGELTQTSKNNVKAIELHFEGFFELVFSIVGFVGLLYISYIWRLELFTSIWYDFVLFYVLFLTFLEILNGSMKLFVGQIRVSRLVNAIIQIFEMVGSIILIIFYPFDVARWLTTFEHPSLITFAEWIGRTTSRPDYALRIFIGITGVFALMNAAYNFIKFGMWKPSDQMSLTIKATEEFS